jgi:hypothetical protein
VSSPMDTVTEERMAIAMVTTSSASLTFAVGPNGALLSGSSHFSLAPVSPFRRVVLRPCKAGLGSSTATRRWRCRRRAWRP